MRLLSLTLPLIVMLLCAQQPPRTTVPPEPASAESVVKFTAGTQLVIEAVIVTDRAGRPLEDLAAQDFMVREDGVPQVISFFEFHRLSSEPPAAAALSPTQVEIAEPTETQHGPETADETRYRDRRLLALYFDRTAMPSADQLRALAAARQFIRTQMTSADMVAVYDYQGAAVKVLQDFTDDRDLLQGAVDSLMAEALGLGHASDDQGAADSALVFGQEDGEFYLFKTDRQLTALQTVVQMLAPLRERKALVYFSSTLRLQGVDNQAQLRATINAAIRANVVFFPVDARGLVAEAPLGDATQASPGGSGMYSGVLVGSLMGGFQRSQDTLYALAADTGGKALLDNNDLSTGIVQAQRAFPSYYILGYYATNAALDGKFRRISIALKETSARLQYRPGYYAPKEFSKFTTADKERQLEEALKLEDPLTDVTIRMEVNYFQLNRAEYYVSVMLKAPGSELVRARSCGVDRAIIDFIGEIKNEYGTTIQNIRDKVDLKISGETAAQLATKPIQYETGFTLLPGTYTIKVLARENETGRIGTYLNKFTIPNLNKETQRLPVSSVILGSQRVPLKEALLTMGKDKRQTSNPLVYEGQKLIPSVTRVFSASGELYVYLEAYQHTAGVAPPPFAFVTFYRGKMKAFETKPVLATESISGTVKIFPLRFALSLKGLPPGRYVCQITVLTPEDQRAAFWQVPVVVIP
jgi:VWFA-related protein